MIAALLLAAVLSGPPADGEVMAFGGVQSCATWLSSESEEVSGSNWIIGFWTGLNMAKSAMVGHTTDGRALVAEVRLVCLAEPSTNLINATLRVYRRFEEEVR